MGCEESGKVRNAFRRLGHDAWSCDLVPSRKESPFHLQKDVIEAIRKYGPWDIIILHPDCTAMAASGSRWYGVAGPLYKKRLAAIKWTVKLWGLAKKHARVGCAIENPVSVLWKHIGRPQYVQPYQFGHGETKKTGILTHNLPALVPTDLVEGRRPRVWLMSPSPTRKRDRSETFSGIASAMAEQWGGVL